MRLHSIGAALALFHLAGVASAQAPAGGEFLVNTHRAEDQTGGRAAMQPDGEFVVVWSSDYQDGSRTGVFSQRFSPSGVPRGVEFRVNEFTMGAQGRSAVAMRSQGDFVVVWHDLPDGGGLSIEGRRHDAAGNAIGGEFRVNTYITHSLTVPIVGMASNGQFVVSWESHIDGHYTGIAARRFDASGTPVGNDFVVNTSTTGHQTSPAIAVDASGSFVIVWRDGNNRDGSGWAIAGQRFDASGNRLGGEFLVNSETIGDQATPSISAAPGGGFVVMWSGPDGSSDGVFARRFDGAGNSLGNDFLVNTYTTGSQGGVFFVWFGQVAHDARGNFVITWGSYGQDGSSFGVFGQRYTASGARRGGEFRVNTYTTSAQFVPSVVSDEVGNFVVVWSSYGQDGSKFGVVGQRFGGLRPAALAVDTGANQVLEPGETVSIRPFWHNFSGAAQAFAGTLVSISGPGGATYSVPDAIADYGTVADAATAPCAECYTVTVSDPPVRPALHWDASAVESILPDTQGQQKEWLLHVGRSFTDVPSTSPFYRFVETLLHKGITAGCTATTYCPAASTTRDQMAVFVLVAKQGTGYAPPACATPMFADVPASSPFCRWIEDLAHRGVVSGCGGGNYCPSAPVTREQMAVFVLRTVDPALVPPACTTPIYNDVPASSPFCPWIEELARRNVVTGCGGGNYCPSAEVTREQMGVFISATFGRNLYGP